MGLFPSLPPLPLYEYELAANFRELNGTARQVLEVFSANLLTVEQVEHEPVSVQGTKLLHQIKDEARLGGADAVEEADVWVQPYLFCGSVDDRPEKCIGEGQESINGVGGGTFGAGTKATDVEVATQGQTEALKILSRRLPLTAEKLVKPFCRPGDLE